MSQANRDNGRPSAAGIDGRPAAVPALSEIPAPLVRVHPDGTVAEANDRATTLLGRLPEEIAGRPLSAIVDGADRGALDHALARPDPFTFTVPAAGTGAKLCLDVVGPAGDGTRLVGLSVAELPGITPVADRRLAELMLKIDEGFVVFDARPSIVECNEASLRILNATREQLIGRRSLTEAGFPILAGEGGVLSPAEGPVGRCLATGEPVEDVVFQTSTPAGPRWIKASVRPIKAADGAVEHVVSYFTDVTRAREIEDLLDLAERRFGTLVEQLPLVVYVDEADAAATSIYVSPQVAEIFGVSVETFSDNETFWSMVHDDDRARVEELLADQLRTNGRFVDEYRLTLPDGRLVWVRDESVVICDDGGNARYVQGYYLDVTEQRAAREALRLERERFAQLAENIEELFYVWDLAEQRFVYMSPAYERLTGSPAEEVYANPLAYLSSVHPDDVQLVTREAFAEQGGRGTVEFRYRRPDGIHGWLLSRWFPVIEDGAPVRVVGLAQDITERKLAEEALDEERFRFAQLATSLQGIFTILDVEQGRYLYVSPAYEKLTGRSLEAVYDDADDLLNIVHPDDLPAGDRARQAVFAGEESEWEFRYFRADGSLGWAWNRRYPVVEDGRVRQIIGFTEDVTERKLAQEALDEERLRFEQLVQGISDIFWIYDLEERRHVFMSPRFEEVTGLTIADLEADPNAFLITVLEEDREIALEMTRARDRGEPIEAEFRCRRPDGRVSWIWDRSFPIVRDGKVVRLAGIAEDITQRKVSEQELAAQQERFEQLAEASTGMFWVYDLELGRHVYMSPAWERITGRPVEAALSEPNRLLELVHPDDIERVRAADDLRDLGVATEEEFRYLRPDGSYGWLWRRSFPVVEGDRVVRIAGLAEDVTERRLQQLELERERERFRTLADNVDGVFWIQDVLAGCIVYVSPAFDEIFGLPREELYRRREVFLESVHPDDRAAVLQMIVEQQAGVATVAEYRIVNPDGTERWIRDRAFPIAEDGRVVRVAGLAEDVSERRRDDAERAELTRRWRELFTDAPVMYVVCSRGTDGRLVIEDVNNALLEALERDRLDVIGQPADELYDNASTAVFWQAGQPGTLPVRNRERTLTSISGRRIDVLIDAVPVLGPGGDVVTIRGTLTDITAKKAVEERLYADADALGRLGGLASSDEAIEVKLERVLRIALDRFGFSFGAVIAASPLELDASPLATVGADGTEPALAAAAIGAARRMVDETGGEVRVEAMPGRPELSLVGLPLTYADGARGAIVFSGRSDAFDAGERELLALMAQWARYELARERSQAELRESETVHRSLSESLRRLGERVEAVREEERSRIAREVHDELGQALTALKFDLHWLHDQVSDEATERLAQMIDMVEQTIDAVRRVCSDLRPPMLDDLGLVAALEWHAANVQRATGLVCRVFASGVTDRAVSPHVATEAFRITQEALTNVARHANASLADVRVHVGPTTMDMRIEDDGCGITGGDTSTGLGILGMRERALRLNGSLEVETGAEGGTRVVLRVPLDPTLP